MEAEPRYSQRHEVSHSIEDISQDRDDSPAHPAHNIPTPAPQEVYELDSTEIRPKQQAPLGTGKQSQASYYQVCNKQRKQWVGTDVAMKWDYEYMEVLGA